MSGDRQSDPVIGLVNFVSPGYLEALGARLIAGRRFADTDNRADRPLVAIISEQTRRMFYPGENPVGQTMVIRGERVGGDRCRERRDGAPARRAARWRSGKRQGSGR